MMFSMLWAEMIVTGKNYFSEIKNASLLRSIKVI